MATPLSIVWFRRDLRIADNPALYAAAERGRVIPVYIWSPEEDGAWSPGAASRWWLHHSLSRLGETLNKLGCPLVLRSGSSLDIIQELVSTHGATAVYWNRLYEPLAIERDKGIKETLKKSGIEVHTCNASLLVEPPRLFNKQGTPFKVFTPFYKAAIAGEEMESPSSEPRRISGLTVSVGSESLEFWNLLPKIPWDSEFYDCWTPGEQGAQAALASFIESIMSGYAKNRDWPAMRGTSRLSPALHFGELSPRQIVAAIHDSGAGPGSESYIREVYWREFAHYLLYHFPHTVDEPLRPEFKDFPWEENDAALKVWQRGETGYPLVDAGMRELWRTGWMHNRVRMVVASFLVKDLRLSWQQGARWFWDTLVDADLANNTLGWQWTAGCGADAAPYFRVFNPVLQGLKFDPQGDYIAANVPELRGFDAPLRHEPWKASPIDKRSAGAEHYPAGIVDHREARDRALEAYQAIKQS